MIENLSVVVAGGGTAGHISPMLAIADALRKHHPSAVVAAVGTRQGMETRLVPPAGYALEFIERVPMPRRPSADLLKLPWRFRSAVRQGREILRRHRAEVLVGVGGYVCTPLYVAAAREGIPVVVHEANRRAGLANRVGARRASAVATAFPDSTLPGARQIGMPMRSRIAGLDRMAQRVHARQRLGLQQDVPTLIVTGGSSGAAAMNQTVRELIQSPAWHGSSAQMLHLTGRGKELRASDGALLEAPGYHQVDYVEGMEDVYAAADLLVARSGAGTVCEVAAVGVPAIFVPLPIGNGEQALNASELIEADAALLVSDQEFTAAWAVEHILPLLMDSQRLEQMSAAGQQLGIRDAAEQMVRIITRIAEEHRGAAGTSARRSPDVDQTRGES